ncbi:SpoIIE family protein phosphatase [Streptomyces sp. NPDC101393]|uniref:SpoIIE family protein phosphatase n=1 Tax=Streptomyces sp. NPDC101393 TaxID=3366141 RepID=UPI0038263E4D
MIEHLRRSRFPLFRGRSQRDRRRGAATHNGNPPPGNGRNGSHASSGIPLRSVLSVRTLAGQLMLLQLVFTVLLVAAATAALVLQSRSDLTGAARQRSQAVAVAFANGPGMARALDGPDPSAVLQPFAEQTRRNTGVDSVVVFNLRGIRYTHPDPSLIGKHVIGPYKDALTGRPFTRTIDSSTGTTVTSIAPVTRGNGSIAGLVSVGITVQQVESAAAGQLPLLLGGAAGALALSAGGTLLLGRRLRRQTHGLGPVEMTRMYEHHDAVLHSVREGVVILDEDGRLLLANDEAQRLLELGPDAQGQQVADLGLDEQTLELLTSRRVATDEVCPAGDRLLAVNIRPTEAKGGPQGRVATLRDTTELQALSGRAEAARERLRLLHDAGARIGSTLDVRRTAEELAEVAVPRFADLVTVELVEPVLNGEEPDAGGGAGLRRAAVGARPSGGSAALRDGTLFPLDERITYGGAAPQCRALDAAEPSLVPGLLAVPGWERQDPDGVGRLRAAGIHSLVTVPLLHRGVVLGLANFWRAGSSAPFDEEDRAVAAELGSRAAVCIDNARRYTREHTTAVTLQRSLLPGALPEQDAVEVAYRYLPAQAEKAGVGGDWFDVIPLPGARVALVVGDVVGHGLHAAATMGRLRTAVHNFSALDLPPGELLGCLDELVTRIDQDRTAEDKSAQTAGATCLYAIYDPASGLCTMATNGHPGPALVLPDGGVSFPEVPVSPPLGLGGEPYETLEVQLPPDSRLVLFTNGLVTDRDRDYATGLDLLHRTLEQLPDAGPDETCRRVFDAVAPSRPSDDIALLVARTRLLDRSQIAEWDVPSDPAAVAPVRADVAGRLDSWGLSDLSFATELILSELVTNAIRYGAEPVRVRLLHTRSLVCEVSDGSSTAPHLRRAATTDEGGRGLYLAAQFSQRWGTRYAANGKVIWTEQALENGASAGDDTDGDALLDQWDDAAW